MCPARVGYTGLALCGDFTLDVFECIPSIGLEIRVSERPTLDWGMCLVAHICSS